MASLIYRSLVAIRGSIPFVIGLILASLMVAPYGAGGFSLVVPSMTMPVVYYWTLRHPDLMPVWAAFVLGLWQDVLIGGPLGLMALLLVLMRGAVETQRPVLLPQPGPVRWFGYAVISLGLVALGWLVAGLWAGHLFNIVPFVLHWLLGTVLYLVLAFLFGRLDHLLFERA